MSELNDTNGTTNNTNPVSQPDRLWEIFLITANIFVIYVIAVWLVFGFIGNLTSIYIFFTKRKIDRVSSGYLGPLAIFDFWNVCTGIMYWMVLGGYITYGESTTGCWVIWFAIQFGMYMSGWILAAFSCERCLVVWFPLKMTVIFTPKLRRNIILILLMCTPMYAVVIITESGYFHGDETWIIACPPRQDVPEVVLFLFWFIMIGFGSALPCLFVLTMNLLILIGIKRAAGKIDGKKHSQNQNEKERRCLRNLLLVSIFYLIFMSPFSVLCSRSASTKIDLPYIDELAFYSLNWASQNYCINPILYCFSLPWYRRAAVKLYTCGIVNLKHSRKPYPQIN